MNPSKPTALKILQGNQGHRPLNKNEPSPPRELPSCPSQLDTMAFKIWKRIGEKLEKLGLMSGIDETVFCLYCQLYSDWLKLTKAVKKEGMFIEIPICNEETGEPLKDAEGKIFTKSVKNQKQIEARLIAVQLKTLAAEFGMSPSSRSRISIEIPGGEEDSLATWEKKKHVG